VHLIWVILIGFVIGAIAKLLMPGKDPGGFFMTALLGIAGSWVGGWLWTMLGMRRSVGLLGSVIGALIILAVYRMLTRK
jgi:uncharacterized membrane protein YeaQ/YmgE (transglycosylase-associated protein family)